MKVSVVIPVYNEEENIIKCLDSLISQQTKHDLEIILVDNGSTDQTLSVVNKKSYHNIKILQEKQKGRGKARKTGFKAATGEIIFSTDADSMVPSNWIDSLSQYFNNPETIAVTSIYSVHDSDTLTNKIVTFLLPLSIRVYKLLFGHYWLSGYSFAIKKSIYDVTKGFDSTLLALEDIDLGFQVNKLGKIQFSPVRVISSGRRYERGLIRGLWSYVYVFYLYYVRKNKKVDLSDIR